MSELELCLLDLLLDLLELQNLLDPPDHALVEAEDVLPADITLVSPRHHQGHIKRTRCAVYTV